jgi:hypothetical protein
MPGPDLQQELQNAPPEPLLAVEKKLIGWSLGIGLAARQPLCSGVPLEPAAEPTAVSSPGSTGR